LQHMLCQLPCLIWMGATGSGGSLPCPPFHYKHTTCHQCPEQRSHPVLPTSGGQWAWETREEENPGAPHGWTLEGLWPRDPGTETIRGRGDSSLQPHSSDPEFQNPGHRGAARHEARVRAHRTHCLTILPQDTFPRSINLSPSPSPPLTARRPPPIPSEKA
jgi:hypothetical protein